MFTLQDKFLRSITRSVSYGLLGLTCLLALAASGCRDRGGEGDKERFYVIAPQAFLRDRVAAAYTKTGTVHNGDPVEAVEKGKRWVRVRTAHGEEGWIEQYNLVGQPVYNAFQQLYKDSASRPAQAHAVLRSDFRLHIAPSRDADKFFLIKEGAKLDLLERATAPRNPPPAPRPTPKVTSATEPDGSAEEEEGGANAPSKSDPSNKNKPASKNKSASLKSRHRKKEEAWETAELPNSPMEDWWLVRDNQNHAGWVLGHSLDVDVPMEIVEYSEGQRIVASYVLTHVMDPEADRPDKNIPYYLVLYTPPHDGLPFDYNQARVFSWNMKRHRYETAYREREIFGLLPVKTGSEDFGKEGTLPTFTLRVRDDAGSIAERKYKMNGVMVRRALPPGEESSGAQTGAAGHRKHHSM